ncbi:NmrA family NAD(P)-binding protein [Ramlibacter sp. AN1133]|uniref:NmrA family NAD(P)-binding protein n=1 Tax=Ramlibacter sp. AN1133 TaxID=3133429 RepID=UPI0030C22D9D
MIAISDPCGPLGALVLQRLLDRMPASGLAAIVRDAYEAACLHAPGVQPRLADAQRPSTLVRALRGVECLLLVGSPAIGFPTRNTLALVDAARTAGVARVVYTSVLHADTSALAVAAEHREVESALRIAGLPHALLRLGCCVEDYTAHVPAALEYQAVLGSAGTGCISCASRADYADAVVAVLLASPEPHGVHELVGSSSFMLPELASEIGRQSGRPIRYVHLPAALYRAALIDAGVHPAQAQQLVDADFAAAQGALLGYENDLERLIGRRAMRLPEAVALALRGCRPQPEAPAAADRPDIEVFA